MSEFYSKETVDAKLDSIHETVQRIEAQTIRTNGRVSKLEKWKYGVVGGMVVIGAMSVPNLSIIAKVFGQ